MQKIDINNWNRAEHYEFFSNLKHPHYHICAEVDVTAIIEAKNKTSGHTRLSDIIYYAAARAANEIDEMRMRIVEGSPVIFDNIDMGFTYIPKNRELHANCVAEYNNDFKVTQKSIEEARNKSDIFPTLKPAGGNRQDLFYFSIISGIHFTSVCNPWGKPKRDSVPRIIFGQISNEKGKKMMPVSVEALHSFIDGQHLTAFYDKMSRLCSEPKIYLNI